MHIVSYRIDESKKNLGSQGYLHNIIQYNINIHV